MGQRDFELGKPPRFDCSRWGFYFVTEKHPDGPGGFFFVSQNDSEYARGYIDAYQACKEEKRLAEIVKRAWIKIK